LQLKKQVETRLKGDFGPHHPASIQYSKLYLTGKLIILSYRFVNTSLKLNKIKIKKLDEY